MHHFVRWTTRLLGHAVAASNDVRLRNHYLAHLSGEINHEVIIERDLAALGEDVTFSTGSTVPDTGTRLFMAVQESLIGFHRDPVLFMASPLAAEGLASHLTPAFVERLTGCAASWGVREPARVISFFTSHVSTDGGEDGHWETTVSLLAEHLRSERDLQRFVGTMRASMKGLSLLYEAAIDDLEIFTATMAS
jgi:hypothetical protein